MLILIAILFPAVGGLLASFLPLSGKGDRRPFYGILMVCCDLLCLLALIRGREVNLAALSDRVVMAFAFDAFGRFFLAAAMILYTAVCFYSFEYMKMEDRRETFMAFFFISFAAMVSVCAARNLLTMYFCFEMATLSTFPLVLHERSTEAVRAGLKYLFYSVAGALMGLLSVFFIYYYSEGTGNFVMGGFVRPERLAGGSSLFLAMVLVGIIGFGTKAGMFPMHGWLPTAHPIAPAPASSLLSGIIAKAGILCVGRLVYYAVGPDLIRGSWVQTVWIILALTTVLMGSTMAFCEKNLKKRLAYSTVSQLSYIMLGMAVLTRTGLCGALIHTLGHSASKGCLFLAAGAFIYYAGIRRVEDLRGIGRKMPVVVWAFMFSALSLVGIPPFGGYLSKWMIGSAALSGAPGIFAWLIPVVLLISALLTAGYLFPVVIDGFFPGKDFPEEEGNQGDRVSFLMTIPMLLLCGSALAAGLFGSWFAGLVTGGI